MSRNFNLKTCSGLEEVFQQVLTICVGIYLSKFMRLQFILREIHNDLNSRTSSTCNTNDLLEPLGLQSYSTNSS